MAEQLIKEIAAVTMKIRTRRSGRFTGLDPAQLRRGGVNY
jgi:hypothetical protein